MSKQGQGETGKENREFVSKLDVALSLLRGEKAGTAKRVKKIAPNSLIFSLNSRRRPKTPQAWLLSITLEKTKEKKRT